MSPTAQRALARGLLGRSLGFCDCPPEALDALIALGQLHEVPRGAALQRRDDALTQCWLVIDGVVETAVTHRDGHRHLVSLTIPGHFVALKALADGLPEPHDLVAREHSVVMAFDLQAFRALRLQHPSLILACERQIIYRYRLLFERMAADPGTPLDIRVAHMLSMLAGLYGQRDGARVQFDVRLSQTDLADWLGLSRQRVNFALKHLEEDGLVDLHYATLTITDLPGLIARAQT